MLVIQVIGDWVASHTHEEVLAAMAEARVPSGQTVSIHIPVVFKAVQHGTGKAPCLTRSQCMCSSHASIARFAYEFWDKSSAFHGIDL